MTRPTTGAQVATRTRRVLPVTDLSLVVLIGATGSGKSTFAAPALQAHRGHLLRLLPRAWSPTTRTTRAPAATPSTSCTTSRASGSPPAASPSSTPPACSPRAASSWSQLAREHDVLPIAIVLDVPEEVCAERNAAAPRPGRHARATSSSATSANCAARCAPWSARASARCTSCAASRRSRPPRSSWSGATTTCTHLTGPFDIIGDIHGCRSELETLLGQARLRSDGARTPRAAPPSSSATSSTAARTAPACCAASWAWSRAGNALCVPGNHENKLGRYLKGRKRPAHPRPRRDHRAVGEARRTTDPEFRAAGQGVHRRAGQPLRPGRRQARGLPRRPAGEVPRPHLGPGALARAVRRHDRRDRRVRPARALPVGRGVPGPRRRRLRPHPGARAPPGSTTPSAWTPACVFGGKMTALRWPERELVDVPAEQVWYEPAKPLRHRGARRPRRAARSTSPTSPAAAIVETRHMGRRRGARGERGGGAGGHEPLRGRPAAAAYLPPTMAPDRDLAGGGLPGAPGRGVRRSTARTACGEVVCEEKHMGSRAVALVCRDADVARGALRRPDGPDRRAAHPHRAAVLRRRGRHRGGPRPAARRRHRRPGSGRSWTPTGCCSTPS